MSETGCSRPAGGPVGQKPAEQEQHIQPEEKKTMVKIGHKAPDFDVPAYHNGEFTRVKLSDYLGKWVALCFYPGDFTFV